MQGLIWLLCAVLIRACVRTYGMTEQLNAQPDGPTDARLTLLKTAQLLRPCQSGLR